MQPQQLLQQQQLQQQQQLPQQQQQPVNVFPNPVAHQPQVKNTGDSNRLGDIEKRVHAAYFKQSF